MAVLMPSKEAEKPQSQTASDYIANQLELEADAREALPYQFDTCTKLLGPLRQTVFSCLTCNPPPSDPSSPYTPAGVCYSCSISCHGEHELVELFSRRDFECDCGTTRLPSTSPCSLRLNDETGQKGGVHSQEARSSNKYNQNYRNRFCGCGELYDPHRQEGTMFQCLGLGNTEDGGCSEDWWHPECVLGISKDWWKSRNDVSNQRAEQIQEGPIEDEAEREEAIENRDTGDERGDGNDEEDELPPGFPPEDDFEHFICYKCVKVCPWIKRYANGAGFLPGVECRAASDSRSDKKDPVPDPVGGFSEIQRLPVAQNPLAKKRSFYEAELEDDEIASLQAAKRAKEVHADTETTILTATKTSDVGCKYEALPSAPETQMSLFLKEDFRDHLCRCASCFPRLKPHPQLLEEEDTYEPPRSESDAGNDESAHSGSTRSLLGRGEAALSNMDRVRAIEGVMAYNHMKDKVKTFLKPFAESGEAVGAEDIKKYFEKLRGDEQAMKESLVGATGGGDGDNRREQSGY